MNPDPLLAAALEQQLARLTPIEHGIAARAAHPPSLAVRSWAGTAATAHDARLGELQRDLRTAHSAVADAVAVTRRELVRARG